MYMGMKRKAAGIFMAAMLCAAGLVGTAEAESGPKITINLASRILTFWRDGHKVSMYPVGVGKVETPTPVGEFAVVDFEMNPEWIDPKDHQKKIPTGEDNPLGYRWLGLNITNYGIHGTNVPESIGGYVSNGCIRMYEENAEELYDLAEIGTPVVITYERLVIERLPDGRVAYYIYPDGYDREDLDVASVKRALERFGVTDTFDANEIAEKIEASDGQPTFLSSAYRIEVNDLWISGKAIRIDNELYVPVASLSALTKKKVVSDWNTGMLSTELGAAPGESVGGVLYVALRDAETLFGVKGELGTDNVLRLRSKNAPKANASVKVETQQAVSAQSAGPSHPTAAPATGAKR